MLLKMLARKMTWRRKQQDIREGSRTVIIAKLARVNWRSDEAAIMKVHIAPVNF